MFEQRFPASSNCNCSASWGIPADSYLGADFFGIVAEVSAPSCRGALLLNDYVGICLPNVSLHQHTCGDSSLWQKGGQQVLAASFCHIKPARKCFHLWACAWRILRHSFIFWKAKFHYVFLKSVNMPPASLCASSL